MELEALTGLLRRLERPEGPVDAVLDTDAYNEVDDQFAISYLLASQDRLRIKALYAAPFFNERSSGPKDGMEKSYQEILRLLRQWQKKENTAEASQQISISIGQVRESADVNQVMEALTAKLREAHLSGARKARGG